MSNDIFRKYIQYTTSYYIYLTFVIEVFVWYHTPTNKINTLFFNFMVSQKCAF